MYCRNCGKEIDENAHVCMFCDVLTNGEPPRRKFYKAGFVLGILSLCIPMQGLILGIIGLPMAIVSKRKSSIIMNSIGIVAWLTIIIFTFTSLFPGFSLSKTALTAQEFSDKATSLGFTVVDVTEQSKGQTVASLLAVDSTKSYQIEFYEVETQAQASGAFSQTHTMLDAIGSGVTLSSSGINWAKYSNTAGGAYGFVSYIDNTFIYVRAPQEYKKAIQAFMEVMGY